MMSFNSRLKTRFRGAVLTFAALGLMALGARLVRAQDAAPKPGFDPKLPTIWVVGDSTARNNAAGAQGWGDPFAAYFDLSKINVQNRAMAGRSSRTFTSDGGGTVFLETEGDIIEPEHIGILADGGIDYATFHFYNGRQNGNPTLAMRTL